MKGIQYLAAFVLLLCGLTVWWFLRPAGGVAPTIVLPPGAGAMVAHLTRFQTIQHRPGSNETVSIVTISNGSPGRVMFASTGAEVLEDGQWVFHPWNSGWNNALNLNAGATGELLTPRWTNGTWRVRVVGVAKALPLQRRVRERFVDQWSNLRTALRGSTTRRETFGGPRYQFVTEPNTGLQP